MPSTFLKTLIFTTLASVIVIGLMPAYLVGSDAGIRGWINWPGLLPVALGAALYLWSVWKFALAGGTPAPIDPPTHLVVSGPYRVIRNPMYVGVPLVLLGESILFSSWAILGFATLVWVLFHLLVVFEEEPELNEKFGPSYGDYCRVVPRWLPGFRNVGD
jgi:protein-S-isoprenylcysteine O-methyltransferase Ste14